MAFYHSAGKKSTHGGKYLQSVHPPEQRSPEIPQVFLYTGGRLWYNALDRSPLRSNRRAESRERERANLFGRNARRCANALAL